MFVFRPFEMHQVNDIYLGHVIRESQLQISSNKISWSLRDRTTVPDYSAQARPPQPLFSAGPYHLVIFAIRNSRNIQRSQAQQP
jgi:hypothetical protein